MKKEKIPQNAVLWNERGDTAIFSKTGENSEGGG